MLGRALQVGDPVAALEELPEKDDEHADRPAKKRIALRSVHAGPRAGGVVARLPAGRSFRTRGFSSSCVRGRPRQGAWTRVPRASRWW